MKGTIVTYMHILLCMFKSIYDEIIKHRHAYVVLPYVHAKCLKEIILVVYFAGQG